MRNTLFLCRQSIDGIELYSDCPFAGECVILFAFDLNVSGLARSSVPFRLVSHGKSSAVCGNGRARASERERNAVKLAKDFLFNAIRLGSGSNYLPLPLAADARDGALPLVLTNKAQTESMIIHLLD